MNHKHLHSQHSLSLARCVGFFVLCSFVVPFLNSYVFICYFLYLYLFSTIHWWNLYSAVNIKFCNLLSYLFCYHIGSVGEAACDYIFTLKNLITILISKLYSIKHHTSIS